MTEAGRPRLRHSVRAIILDQDDHILLAEYALPHIRLWAAPGGGTEAGESFRDTLARELREEIGIDLPAEPLAHLWHRVVVAEHVFPGFDGIEEDYFLLRTNRFDPRGDLTDEELASENMGELRWWSPEAMHEADTTGTKWSPRHLPTLLANLKAQGPPPTPTELGL